MNKLIKNFTEEREKFLLCFPYAGGSASVYRAWKERINKEIQISAIQLPGREQRISEEAYQDIKEVVKDVASKLEKYKDYIFGGHSMGAKIAYESVCYFQRYEEELI